MLNADRDIVSEVWFYFSKHTALIVCTCLSENDTKRIMVHRKKKKIDYETKTLSEVCMPRVQDRLESSR